jgi:hypothetical protein
MIQKMKVDMSPEAIDARLKRTSELLDLCLSHGKAGPVQSKSNASKAVKDLKTSAKTS